MCCTVGKCCCCINLRTGVIIIASIWLVGDSLILAWKSLTTYALNSRMPRPLSEAYWDAEPTDRDVYEILLIVLFCFTVVYDVLYSLAVLLDIMLLLGAITVRPKLLHGWMVAYAVVYLLVLIISLLNFSLTFFYNPLLGVSFTAGFLVHAGLTVYFWIVVRSYYLELGQQFGYGPPRTTAGKVYRTVPTGDVVAAHGTSCEGNSLAMEATAQPPYTNCA